MSFPKRPRAAGGPAKAVPIEKVRQAHGKAKVAVPRSKVASTRAFRRTTPDRVFGALGALLIVFTGYLIFTWEEPVKKVATVGLDWVDEPSSLFQENVTLLRGGGAFTQSFDVMDENITLVSMNVWWSDDYGDQGREWDSLVVNLTGPPQSNVAIEVSDTADRVNGVNVTPTAVVASAPSIRQVPARSEEQAREVIGDQTTRNGTGAWTLTIRLTGVYDDYSTEAAREAGPCPTSGIPNVCIYDPGQWVNVHIVFRKYHLEFKP